MPQKNQTVIPRAGITPIPLVMPAPEALPGVSAEAARTTATSRASVGCCRAGFCFAAANQTLPRRPHPESYSKIRVEARTLGFPACRKELRSYFPPIGGLFSRGPVPLRRRRVRSRASRCCKKPHSRKPETGYRLQGRILDIGHRLQFGVLRWRTAVGAAPGQKHEGREAWSG